MDKSVFEDYVEKWYDFAAGGELEKLKTALKVLPDINAKNERGWTALMFAARNGHTHVVKFLLHKGCDVDVINGNGQNALEIARFWRHEDVVKVLQTSDTATPDITPAPAAGRSNYFSDSILNRAAHRRKDSDWLKARLDDPLSTFIVFSDKLYPVAFPKPADTASQKNTEYKLLRLRNDDVKDFLSDENKVVVFLGVEDTRPKSERKASDVKAGTDESDIAWFAVTAGEMSEERVRQLNAHGELLSPFPGAMLLDPKEAGIYAQARSLLSWHERYRYCATCGSPTKVEDGGHKRACTKEDCISLQGVHNTSYPRVDPTVIMAVQSSDGTQLLLGRGARFPRGMWSCLAGFIEPGESIEDACRREVHEEAGITVGRVEYHSCQTWPMPSSLMLGCLAHAVTTDIKVDTEELSDARWFSRQDIIQMLGHKHPKGFFCPPDTAIAHQLIRSWVVRTSNL